MLRYLVEVGEYKDSSLDPRQLFVFIGALWRRKLELINLTWPMLLPVVGFVAVVLKTGSIVLGEHMQDIFSNNVYLLVPWYTCEYF